MGLTTLKDKEKVIVLIPSEQVPINFIWNGGNGFYDSFNPFRIGNVVGFKPIKTMSNAFLILVHLKPLAQRYTKLEESDR